MNQTWRKENGNNVNKQALTNPTPSHPAKGKMANGQKHNLPNGSRTRKILQSSRKRVAKKH